MAPCLVSGKRQIQRERCNLAELLANCATSQQHKASARQQTVEVSIESPSLAIISDNNGLASALKQLLENAIKFTPEGGRIGLEAYRTPATNGSEPRTVDLVVWDTGVGIMLNELDDIRKPFVQADGSLSRQHEGIGMGLTYADQMIRLLGGTLAVASVPGQGSRFV